MLSASYSREDETGADRFAVSFMHGLGRPTAPLGMLLERVTGTGGPEAPSILRSHPPTAERKAMLEAENVPATGPALVEDGEWQDLKRTCDH